MPEQEITKVYIYTRVSTALQIDGFSLEAQKTRMRAFADYNNYQMALHLLHVAESEEPNSDSSCLLQIL